MITIKNDGFNPLYPWTARVDGRVVGFYASYDDAVSARNQELMKVYHALKQEKDKLQ